MNPRLSVVIPTFNRADGLERVLRALEGQRPGDFAFEVVVIDDGSDDRTPELLASWRSRRFRLRFDSQPNGGPARARNRALEMVSGDLVLFGGDDIEPDANQVWEHITEHDRRGDRRAAVLGLTAWPDGVPLTSTMRHIDGPGSQQFSYHAFAAGDEVDFRHFYTSNVSLARAVLTAEPGGFSTAFRWAAFEDAELAYRLSKRGLRIFYHPAARAWHHHPYDARSFFIRQRRCGEMANVLFEHHPELAKWVDVADVEWGRIGLLAAGAAHRSKVREIVDDLGGWEKRATDLAVYLDDPVTELADTILHPLFRYAFLSGLATSRFGAATGDVLAADLWLRLIPPAVDVLARQAAAVGVPLPRRDVDAIISVGESRNAA